MLTVKLIVKDVRPGSYVLVVDEEGKPLVRQKRANTDTLVLIAPERGQTSKLIVTHPEHDKIEMDVSLSNDRTVRCPTT